jgi:hypothetical protein
MKLDHPLIAAFVRVVDDPHRLRAHRIPDAVQPGDQNEPPANPLPLSSHTLHSVAHRTLWEHSAPFPSRSAMPFFKFPEDVRWNADREAVEFSVILDPYEGTVTVSRRVFQRLLDQSPTPERCLEAFHLQRTRFEIIVERKLRRRQLTDDGNVEITGRDLREKKSTRVGADRLSYAGGCASKI